jgi:hypothetical protein
MEYQDNYQSSVACVIKQQEINIDDPIRRVLTPSVERSYLSEPDTKYSPYLDAVALMNSESLMRTEAKKKEKFRSTLIKLQSDGEITSELLAVTEKFYDFIDGNLPGVMRVPFLGVSNKDCLLLFWDDKKEHYLSLEIFSSGEVEIFYQNQITKLESFEESNVHSSEISSNLLNRLKIFRVVK